MTTPDGRFLEGEQIKADGDVITEGITREMLFTLESSDTEGAFYIRGSKGYLNGRRETEYARSTWGITASGEPDIKVTFENGKLNIKNSGTKGYGAEADGGKEPRAKEPGTKDAGAKEPGVKDAGSDGASAQDRASSSCFYFYDGHFNYGDFKEGSDFVIYEVDF